MRKKAKKKIVKAKTKKSKEIGFDPVIEKATDDFGKILQSRGFHYAIGIIDKNMNAICKLFGKPTNISISLLAWPRQ